jgi:hypothetical protein
VTNKHVCECKLHIGTHNRYRINSVLTYIHRHESIYVIAALLNCSVAVNAVNSMQADTSSKRLRKRVAQHVICSNAKAPQPLTLQLQHSYIPVTK